MKKGAGGAEVANGFSLLKKITLLVFWVEIVYGIRP
jgi:hypothetical protein